MGTGADGMSGREAAIGMGFLATVVTVGVASEWQVFVLVRDGRLSPWLGAVIGFVGGYALAKAFWAFTDWRVSKVLSRSGDARPADGGSRPGA